MRKTDAKRKLIDYIKKNLRKGYTEESLKWALIRQGYSRVAVEDAIKHAHIEFAKTAPVLREKPVIKYEVIDENNMPVNIKRPWWKKFF